MTLLEKYRLQFLKSPDDGGGSGGSSPGADVGASASGGANEGGSSTPSDGGAAGSAPPAPGGETAPPASPASGSDFASQGFDSLGALDDLDSIELPPRSSGSEAAQGGAQTPKPGEPAAGEAQAPTPPTGTPQAPAPAAPATPQEGTATPQPAGSGEVKYTTPEEVLQGFEKPEMAKPMMDWLSANIYNLSDELKQALDTDAVSAIPQIMSKVHIETTKAALKLMSTLMPQMIQKTIQRHETTTASGKAAMADFFKAWPGLKQDEHTNLVNEYAAIYRARNPSAPRADAIKWVGAAIHAHLGLQPNAPQAQANGTRPAPFVPARPGRGTVIAQTPVVDPFGGLGQEFDDDTGQHGNE